MGVRGRSVWVWYSEVREVGRGKGEVGERKERRGWEKRAETSGVLRMG